MSKQTIYTYPGKHIDIDWDEKLCIHIGECGYSSGELFVSGRTPWCNPDLASLDEIDNIISRCPSGALSYRDKQGRRAESAPPENSISVSYNGPYFIHADLQIEGITDEMPGTQFRAALCRCGMSSNKPFCDNSHLSSFKDSGAVGNEGTGNTTATGPLKISCLKNGPLLVTGNCFIRSGSGRKAWHGKETALCRCGASRNKPFCDGSHNTTGFNTSE